MDDKYIMPLTCIRCGKDKPMTYGAMKEVSYTHYSYCEECLRKGLKALRVWDEVYKQVYDHHYEILRMKEGEAKKAKLSLSNWVLDLMTGYDIEDLEDATSTANHFYGREGECK